MSFSIIDILKRLLNGSNTGEATSNHLTSKKAIEKAFECKELQQGDFIELQFKDPQKEIGIQNIPNHTTYTRFNVNDFGKERIVRGIVLKIWKEPKPLNEWFIEIISSVTLPSVRGNQERKILLMSSEINWIKKI